MENWLRFRGDGVNSDYELLQKAGIKPDKMYGWQEALDLMQKYSEIATEGSKGLIMTKVTTRKEDGEPLYRLEIGEDTTADYTGPW